MKLELVTENGREVIRRIIEPLDFLRSAHVPERHKRLVLAGCLEETDALEMARKLLKGEGLLLILAGEPGRGKSIAAAWTLSRTSGIWVHAPELATPPRDEDFDNGKLTLDERMRKAELLVLDDVGIEHSPRGYAAGRILGALETREAELKPTIVTTNLSTDEFARRYGDRLVSRIEGDGLGWMTCGGADLRATSP